MRSLPALTALFAIIGPFVGNAHCQDPRTGPSAAPLRVDTFRDPLPTGVQARMGSIRLDCEESIASAAFAADGKTLSVMTYAKYRQLWFFDAASGKTIRRLSAPEGACQHALTLDGKFLVVRTFYQKSGSGPGVINFGEVHVLDAANGKLIWKTDPKHEIGSMAL